MARKEEGRIFVGGLSWQTDERKLEEAFSRFGKVVDAQV
jgi:heterogeneous nuclear ribonucleoprotein G